ncbi:B3 domain-containing protein Os01g0234100-like isoform X2 [Salvia hispanica]|uniref:B3 domain-containing protein Os01g0234100-like isoform X2 n=1 Tax=Salvia hispanica TaxID=49212 RepID=UPI0020095D36|nr:B3 domain-containing protein Os01g0234100-like isoform X2 [Salvia hispanica]
MAVSPVHDSTGAIICKKLKRKIATPEESKAKHNNAIWENKRRLVEQRLMNLDHTHQTEESIPDETAIVVHRPKDSPTNDVNTSVGVSSSAMERAQEVKANLSRKYPSFIKLMLKSHVSGGFWLGLPKNFCVAHLPKQDEIVVLVGENEYEYSTRYLMEKTGLSGGWRTFSIAHKLLAGDVLVYQLIEPRKLKVHIVRESTENVGVASLPNLSLNAEPIKEVKQEEEVLITKTARKCLKLICAENGNKINDIHPSEGASVDDNDYSSTESMNAIRFSESVVSFKEIKGFADFSIHVDGLMIDSEIPLHLRTKYYEICRSQNKFLHENLMKGFNAKLAAGMISETINIAGAIRAATDAAADHLHNWDTTLKAFEDLGMEVGFLRARIDKLLSISREAQAAIKLKRQERAEAKEETRRLNIKLLDVKVRIQNLDAEIDGLVKKNEEQSYIFGEVAAAPW